MEPVDRIIFVLLPARGLVTKGEPMPAILAAGI